MSTTGGNRECPSGPSHEPLDRAVLFATLGGLLFNALSLNGTGSVLVLSAASIYTVVRNRLANAHEFESLSRPSDLPPVELDRFTLLCRWFGSRTLYDGLLGDLMEPEIARSQQERCRYLRCKLPIAICHRMRHTLLRLLWLEC